MSTKPKALRHPIQPLYVHDDDVLRFKRNALVCHLMDHGKAHGCGLNELASMGDHFTREDWEQFAQLIGYSLSGFGELSYVSDETYNAAERMARKGKDEKDARIADLEAKLAAVRKHLKALVPTVFQIHPDDLTA